MIRLAFVTVAVLFLLGLAYEVGPAIGTPSGADVGHSLTSETGGWWIGEACKRTAPGRMRCFVTDPRGSGGWIYRVRLHGRCWNAQRVGGGGESRAPAKQPKGCVHLSDQIRISL